MEKEIIENVKQGSVICTDDHRSYIGLKKFQPVKHNIGEYVKGDHPNSIESVWALLKRGVYETYHHVSPKHFHRYVNEVAFRLNEGKVKDLLSSRIAYL